MTRPCSRRRFLGLAAGAPLAMTAACGGSSPSSPSPSPTPTSPPPGGGGAAVTLTRCRSYGNEALEALRLSFDRLGGIGSVVSGRVVTVKVNLTGWPYRVLFGRPPGETYITHGDTALALAQLLIEAGAARVRFVESAQTVQPLEYAVDAAGWDVAALQALGVEFENTRNLGLGSDYARLSVPDGGRLFSYFDLNHSYQDTDVYVSLCKMKEHATAAGVTLSMKNSFGITPNSLYGAEGVGEDRLGYRGPIHNAEEGGMRLLPGEIPGNQDEIVGVRVPWTIVDQAAARPTHLAIVDGITTIYGGEGWWNPGIGPIAPGVLVVGLDPVATDAVSMAVMGFDPHAPDDTAPFETRLNHVAMAEQAGLGSATLSQIDVRGLSIEEALTPFRASGTRPWETPPSLGTGTPIG